jgi:hypothetical protein
MYQGKFVFSQIMDRLPWRRFQTCVERYRGDYNVQTFKCSDYFRVMAFAQLTYSPAGANTKLQLCIDTPPKTVR